MIFKMHKNGKLDQSRSGINHLNYILYSKHRKNSKIIFGNEYDTISIVNNLLFKNIYASGSLIFEENNIDNIYKYEIIDSFEKCLFPNMEKSQYNVLWIESKILGKLNLTYIIPMQELYTKKSLEVYMHKYDFYRIKIWQEIINYEYKLTSPDEYNKIRLCKIPIYYSRENKFTVKNISMFLLEKIRKGLINNVDDLIKELKYINYEIIDKNNSSILVKTTNNLVIKFKREIYEKRFNNEFVINNKNINNFILNEEDIYLRYVNLKKKYLILLNKRILFLEKKGFIKNKNENRTSKLNLIQYNEKVIENKIKDLNLLNRAIYNKIKLIKSYKNKKVNLKEFKLPDFEYKKINDFNDSRYLGVAKFLDFFKN